MSFDQASRARSLNISLFWKKGPFLPRNNFPSPKKKKNRGSWGKWEIILIHKGHGLSRTTLAISRLRFDCLSPKAKALLRNLEKEDSLLSANESLAITLWSDCAFVSLLAFHVPARWLAASAILPAQQADELLFNKALVNLFPPGDPYFPVR